MKLPEYALKQGLKYRPPDSGPDDEMEFPSGTLVFVFWNETLLPSHHRQALEEARRESKRGSWDGKIASKIESKLLMCIIGRHWIIIPSSYIRSNG